LSAVRCDADMITHHVLEFSDITEFRQAREELVRRTNELSRSNRELEQFAYVASHDLQEPLRMVASYTQLIAQRYREKLDADADEFIGYVVDGATRMQALINDLLTLSRVSTRDTAFDKIDSKAALDKALGNLKLAIEETGARIVCGSLPMLNADGTQLTQLFQNLIGNAIKFRGDNPPCIEIGAEQQDEEWVFHVRDNGIGIAPEYFERIFLLFQRLHGRHEYPGTGIGLTLCKKIVERHGGRIWIASEQGKGTTFYFAIPTSPSQMPYQAKRRQHDY
jgi:light-regulated signal transduction histidine kinase (bacteriophytochrome)